jgi:hypothetical protein
MELGQWVLVLAEGGMGKRRETGRERLSRGEALLLLAIGGLLALIVWLALADIAQMGAL